MQLTPLVGFFLCITAGVALADPTSFAVVQMGLVGEWARDCTQDDVRWKFFIDRSGNAFMRVYERATDRTIVLDQITGAARPNVSTIRLDVLRSGVDNIGQATFAVEENTLKLSSYRGGVCTDAVANGKNRSGVDLPRLNRCDKGQVSGYVPEGSGGGYSSPSGCAAESGYAVSSGYSASSGYAASSGYSAPSGRTALEQSSAVGNGPVIPTGPVIPSGPTISSGPNIPRGPSISSGPIIPSGPTISSGPTIPRGPAIIVGPSLGAQSRDSSSSSGRPVFSSSSSSRPATSGGPIIPSGSNIAAGPVISAKPKVAPAIAASAPLVASSAAASQRPSTSGDIASPDASPTAGQLAARFYVQSGTGAKLTADQIRRGTIPEGTVFIESGSGRQMTTNQIRSSAMSTSKRSSSAADGHSATASVKSIKLSDTPQTGLNAGDMEKGITPSKPAATSNLTITKSGMGDTKPTYSGQPGTSALLTEGKLNPSVAKGVQISADGKVKTQPRITAAFPSSPTSPVRMAAHPNGFFSQQYRDTDIKHAQHLGVDLPAKVGTEVVSPVNGTIEKITPNGGESYVIIQQAGSKTQHILGHISCDGCYEGQMVHEGAKFGSKVLSYPTGDHVHWGVNVNGIPESGVSAGWGRASSSVTESAAMEAGWRDPLSGRY